LLFLLVLGGMGLVFGNWTDNLNINGSVRTAEIQVDWVIVGTLCTDNDGSGAPGDPGKNVGSTLRNLVDGKIVITTTNGYPGYSAKCNATIQNTGKLPVRVGGLEIVPLAKDGTSDLTGCTSVVNQNDKNVVTSALLTCPQLTVRITNGQQQINGCVTHPDECSDVFSITTQVQKGALENQNLDFQLAFCIEPAIESNQCKAKAVE
jgi:hypothetical protein